MRRIRSRQMVWGTGLLVVGFLTVMVVTPQGRAIFSRFEADHHAGLLEQTVGLFIYRATLDVRQSIARGLGLMPRLEKPENQAARATLSEFKVVSGLAPERRTLNLDLTPVGTADWHHSFGDATGGRFSALNSINRTNVSNLAPAWTYEGEGKAKAIQATPVYTGNAVVFPDTSDRIVAVDPATGSLLWRFDPNIALPARRGLAFVKGDSPDQGKIFFAAGGRLFALWAKNGTPVEAFNGGSVAVGYDTRVAPMVSGNNLIVASFKPALHLFDVSTGKLRREVDYLAAFDNRNWLARFLSATPDYGGANPWGGIAVDDARGIAFLSTSNPGPVGVGIDRPGDNRPTASVLAILLKTGKVLWSFQDVRHDLWDLDIGAPPILATISRDGGKFDVVVAATKSGNLLLLDRMTGKPIFDFRLRRAPVSTVPGEQTAPYQPDPLLPQPFARMAFTPKDVTNIGGKNRVSVVTQIEKASMGFYPPHVPDVPTIFYGLHGGGMHFSTTVNPRLGVVYIAASHVPSIFTITRGGGGEKRVQGSGAASYRNYCAGCHGQKLEGNGDAPPLSAITSSFDLQSFRTVIRNGVRAMPSVTGITDKEIEAIHVMLKKQDGNPSRKNDPDYDPTVAARGSSLRRTAYSKLRDYEGYPGSRPPWGTMTAINLNTGRRLWQVPLGRHDELMARGLPQTGTENIGASMNTAGGLVFASGTKDNLIRAFNSQTGTELWEAKLPFIGSSSPMTYFHKGRQYVLIAATGGGTLSIYDNRVRAGRSFVAFALPK